MILGKTTTKSHKNGAFSFASRRRDKLAFALALYFAKGIARHVLDAWMNLVHDCKQLGDDCFQQFPIHLEEVRLLDFDIRRTIFDATTALL